MDWNQWNAQRGATTTAPATAGLQPPGGYPSATGAGGMSAPVPPVGAVPPSAAGPVGGYPMGYPYYGSPGMPSVPGYNPQWAMGTQQQNWQQWEQWQQQYAQWHQQYGTKYQQQMAAMQGVPGTPGVGVTPGMPPTTLPSAAVEQPKDMPSYNTADTFGHQQKSSSDLKTAPSIGDKRSLDDGKGDSTPTDSKKSKSSDSKKETLEELIEAEKAFDVQFKNWESQFDKWKEQNVNHPDKTQYREYESKWESWREQLIQKREQMKKKREVKMEEIKQETAKAAAEAAAASVSAAAAAAATGSISSTTSAPPTMYNTAASGYPTPGQVPPGGGYPSMMTGHPPMFGSPFPGGYNNQPYGSPVAPNQQPPFMNQGVAPPLYPPSMNMPPPMMNMGMPPMLSQSTPDVGSASLNTSHDKQSSNVDQSKDHQSNNSQLGFVGSSSNQGNKGIPGLDLLSGGSSGQGNKNDSNFRGGRGGNDLGYPEPVNKSQPLLKTSDDCKAFDFPKSDPGSRFSGGPESNSGFGGPQSFGKPPFGGDNFGNMKQPPSFSQFNLPPPKMGGPFEGDSPFRNKQGIPSLMDGFDKNRGPPPGFLDKKDNKDGNKNFDDDFKGGPGSRFAGSRWGPEGDSPIKSSRWGESDLPPDESTNFSRGSVGSKDGPDRFRSSGGGPNDDDRFLGPRGGNLRDRFPPRGPFDRPFDDFPDRPPPFGGDKFGPGPTGPRDFDDKLNDPGRSLGDRQGPRGGFTDIDDRFVDQDDRTGPGPRGGPDFPGRNEFGDRFPRAGPNGPGDRFGFKDGPDRFPDLRGPGDGPDRFGGPRDERDRPFGPRGDDFDKFPGLRGPGDSDRFPPRFRGGGGLLGDGPPDRFGGRDNQDDFPNDGPGDGPDRFFPRGPDGGRFGNRFGDSPRAAFDEPGGFNKPGGFGFRDSGDRFSGPDRGFDDDRRSFGGPSGDLPGDRFPRFSDPVTSPGRFDGRGKTDVPPFGGPAKSRPVSLLDLPPIKPPPNIDPDGPMGPPRGRPDLDFDDDRFDSPGNKNWGAGSGGPGPGPSPGSGNNEDWSRFSGPSGPGPSPDRLSDWKRQGSGPPPFPPEVQNEWDNMRPSTVVDYGHRPPTSGFGEFDEPESLEPIRTFDYEHGSKRGTANSSRWGGPDGDSRMSGNSRDRSGGGGSSGPSPREDRYNRGGSRGSGGFNKDRVRDSDMHDRDNRNRGSRDDFKYSKDKDNDKYRNSSNSDYDRKSGGNRNKSMNNRERGNDDSTKPPQHAHPVTKEPPVLIDDLLSNANRATRPPKIIIILRGPPGSGKTYFAKLVKDKEVEMSGSAPRILSLDDYFIVETDREEKDPETGRKINKKVMEYEYEANMEPHYRTSLLKAFKKTISDGYFPFIVIDCVNDKISHYDEMYSFGKQNGFQVYIAEMDMDVGACAKRNIHKRTEKDISTIVKNWEPTPPSHITLDTRSFLQAAAITDVVMEDSVPDDKSNSNSGQNEAGVGDDKDKNEKKGKGYPGPPRTSFGRHRPEDEKPETNLVVLKRREKQIGYVKRLPKYVKYIEIIQANNRRPYHPVTPDLNKQMSRRAWENSVQLWRDSINDWWDSEGQGLDTVREYVKNSNTDSEEKPAPVAQENEEEKKK